MNETFPNEEDITDSLDETFGKGGEKTMTETKLPEAPMSITTTAYYKGFSMLITKRDPDVKVQPLIEQQITMIDYLIEKGFKPSWNPETNRAALGGNDQPVVQQTGDYQREPYANTPGVYTGSQTGMAGGRAQQQNQNAPLCSIHKAKMKWRTTKSGGGWWDHRWEEPKGSGNWQQCKGLPTDANQAQNWRNQDF